ncbi:unnamed protein product [Schistosoma mattheei]|uniref:GT23 domain-containing protein n=1 Tax=Schistosoma mattheei TaxID=31246 RepID=A0AA85BKB8_9TREM|nr:unnamed protein product [Schistosoma mattheei]
MRMSVNSMNNAIIDIIALSMTDFLVCTFSSNVCRLAYELMQTRHMELGDATQLFHSIDKLFHEEDYGRLKFDVIISDMKVNLKYGDVVEIRQINWNGSVLVKLVQSSEDIHNKNQKVKSHHVTERKSTMQQLKSSPLHHDNNNNNNHHHQSRNQQNQSRSKSANMFNRKLSSTSTSTSASAAAATAVASSSSSIIM